MLSHFNIKNISINKQNIQNVDMVDCSGNNIITVISIA